LTATEQIVLERLEHEERDAAWPRMGRIYRRVIELSRSDDEVDAVLAAHLVRELLFVLPRIAVSVPVERGHLDYKRHVQAIVDAWPGARDGPIPTAAIDKVRALLDEHEQASRRALSGPDEFIRGRDPGRATWVPDESIGRWRRLSHDGSGYAHRVREIGHDLPAPGLVRRLIDELTAALLGVLAPWFVSIDEVDRMLALETPTESDARTLIQILTTPSQLYYFYSRADERWLGVMAKVDRGVTHPPDLVVVEGGMQAPGWAQGHFLSRVAAAAPDAVTAVALRVRPSSNYRVLDVIVDIALALPVENAVRLLPSLERGIGQATFLDFVAVDVGKLVQRLSGEGHPGEGAELLVAMVRPLAVPDRRMSWDLEQLLESVESVAGAGECLGTALYGLLKRTYPARRLRKCSTMWLRNIDRKPRYGADAQWMLANALYRFLLTAPISAAVACIGTLLGEREAVPRRIALAAIADRLDLLDVPDPLLLDAAAWDDEASTRYEFRRALGAMWPRASQAARTALLKYAADAVEAEAFVERAATAGSDRSPDEIRRIWRGRLLHRIAHDLPKAWLKRYGPLPEIEDDRIPEMTAGWSRDESPIEASPLAELPVEETLALLDTWSEPDQHHIEGPTLAGLARKAGEVIPARLAEFAEHTGAIARLRPAIVGAITSGIERALRENKLEDPASAVAFVIEVVGQIDTDHGSSWHRELLRDAAGCIEIGAHKELLGQAAMGPALRFLRDAFDRGPATDWRERGPSDDWDAGMVALNTLRGEVATALAEILIEAGRRSYRHERDEASTILRQALVHPDGAVPVRAAIGLRLPWILGHDADRQGEWTGLLFGPTVDRKLRDACWQAYLLYSRLFRETVVLLDGVYLEAVATLTANEREEPNRPRDDLEKLGVHVAWAHVLGIPAEADGSWLVTFYSRAPDWARARVTRWIAEQAAAEDASREVRDRARDFLATRVADADPQTDKAELGAVSWIASAGDRPSEVLTSIILPALEKSCGRTENEQGATELVDRISTTCPGAAGRALHLLVDGDEWHSLPHIAAEPLRSALQKLMASGDPEARAEAEATIHILGAQGFLEYRDLLDLGDQSANGS
jgi:hypothetical protein